MCEVLDKLIAKGEARGEARGRAEGEARGIAKGKIIIIRNMLGRYPNEEIADISGFTVAEIEEIARNTDKLV